MKEIGSNAFEGCTSLISIKIPNRVKEIRDKAFKDCTGLTSLEIPSSVTWVGEDAFSGCTNLLEIHLHKRSIDLRDSFRDLDLSKITLYVPIGSIYANRHHPFYSKFKEVVIEK